MDFWTVKNSLYDLVIHSKAWISLNDMTVEESMVKFCEILENASALFEPYMEAQKQDKQEKERRTREEEDRKRRDEEDKKRKEEEDRRILEEEEKQRKLAEESARQKQAQAAKAQRDADEENRRYFPYSHIAPGVDI